ncbi:expressed unknown protein [Seminavis robusta]|uniref:Uncharacterized protein n=1 Tax=Seminavis robusta TaxID=568900 RepID=A0A9N8DIP9_9STRA|nr:expressed unknown protein [Seminavis robusta]|eukprot:Sro104_g052930.1 n/a (324) ;mRNA; r:79585-80556
MVLLSAFAGLAVAVATPAARFSVLGRHRKLDAGNQQHRRWQQFTTAAFRGGSSDPASYDPPQPKQFPYQPQDYEKQQQRQQQHQQQQQQPQYEYTPPEEEQQFQAPSAGNDVPFQEETFQERVDTWRNYQLEHAAEQRSSLSPRDEKGNLKLLVSVTKASRSLTFFFMMWRNVHLYEVVDQKLKAGILRHLCIFPLTLLFIANLAGVVASVSSPGHKSKKRLKAILNLDKLVEIFLIFLHVFKLLFSTSNLVPKELYISHILHSVFFLLQCHTMTRFVWDGAVQTVADYSETGGPDQQPQKYEEDMEPMQPDSGYDQQSPYRY